MRRRSRPRGWTIGAGRALFPGGPRAGAARAGIGAAWRLAARPRDRARNERVRPRAGGGLYRPGGDLEERARRAQRGADVSARRAPRHLSLRVGTAEVDRAGAGASRRRKTGSPEETRQEAGRELTRRRTYHRQVHVEHERETD